MSSFAVAHRRASVAELVALGREEAPAGRLLSMAEVTDQAVVLGSTQPASDVDEEAAARRGLMVARRPSGGGAVLVRPGGQVWADLFLPAGDPLLAHDLSASFDWLGQAWARALASLGVGDLLVASPGTARHPLERKLCFLGQGAGEVMVAGRKVVGISQRRRREGAFFFSMLALEDASELLVSCLRFEPDERAEALAALGRTAGFLPLDALQVEEALLAALA